MSGDNGPSTNAPAASASKKEGEHYGNHGVGPAGFDMHAEIRHTDGQKATGKPTAQNVKQALNKLLDGKPGVETISQELMDRHARINAKPSPGGARVGMKAVQAKATDSLVIAGKTPEQLAGIKSRAEEILAVGEKPVTLQVGHMNAQAQDKIAQTAGAKGPAQMAGQDKKAVASNNGAKPQYAGMIKAPGMGMGGMG